MLKQLLKKPLILSASYFGQHRQKSKEAKLWILMYHRILPSNDTRFATEEPGMVITPETLDMHLQEVKKFFQPVHLSQWLQDKHEGKPLPNKACAITFDDGWLDNYEYAWPVLKKHNMPASIFIVADMIGTNRTFWPNMLATLLKDVETEQLKSMLSWIPQSAEVLSKTSIPYEEKLAVLIHQAKQLNEKDIYPNIAKLDFEFNHQAVLMNWQQIKELNQSPLIEFGSHTSNHLRLNNKLDIETTTSEIINSKKTIEKNLEHEIRLFCYPNGDHSNYAAELVKDTYLGAVTTAKGINKENQNPATLTRIAVHEDIASSKHSFGAKLSTLI